MNIKKYNNGYTYIELLGVLAIIVLVISPLIYMLSNVFSKSLETQSLTQANLVLNSIVNKAIFDVKHMGNDAIREGEISSDDYVDYNIPNGYTAKLKISSINEENIFSIEVVVNYKQIELKTKTMVYYE